MKRKHSKNNEEDGPDKPSQGGVFQLQCNDHFGDRFPDEILQKKWTKKASQVAHALAVGKVAASGSYKDVATILRKLNKVSFPFNTDFLQYTDSAVDGFRWIPQTSESVSVIPPPLKDAEGNYFVDLFLTMPRELLGQNDYINLVYETKRALYLSCCASLLSKVFDDLTFSWTTSSCASTLLPLLTLSPADNESVGVRIHCTAEMQGWVKKERFLPSIGNVRPSLFLNGSKDHDKSATPNYSQSLLSHLLYPSVYAAINEHFQENVLLGKAIALIEGWHAARKEEQVHPLLPSLLLWHLSQGDEVSGALDVPSVLTAYLTFIANWDTSEPLEIERGLPEYVSPNSQGPDAITQLKSAFPIVIVDGGVWNVGAKLQKQTVQKLKAEAFRSLELIGQSACFEDLFMEKKTFEDTYDYFFSITVPQSSLSAPSYIIDSVTPSDRLRFFTRRVLSLVEEGMKERYEYASVKLPQESREKWPCSSAFSSTSPSTFSLAFRASKDWGSPLTVGPVANLPEAEPFRKFWGGKTELRRFGDNAICETMTWGTEVNNEVPRSIVEFLCSNHLNLHKKNIAYHCHIRPKYLRFLPAYKTTSEMMAKIGGILRNMKDLPLGVANIHYTSAYLRGTEPNESYVSYSFPTGLVDRKLKARMPVEGQIPQHLPTVEILLRLEYSTRWGTEEGMVRRFIMAFYLELAEKLGQEHKFTAVPSPSALHVIVGNIVFRIVIINYRLISFLQREVEGMRMQGLPRVDLTPQAVRLAALKKSIETEPAVKQALHSLTNKYPYFADACQLFKRWMASRCLSDCLHELAAEMIVAAAFEFPKSLGTPNSATAAFRRVLLLLTTHNWIVRPLIVDLDGRWTEGECAKIIDSFVQMRPVLPPMVICTQEDPVGSKWTADSPSPLLLKRLIAYARQSLTAIDNAFNLQGEKKHGDLSFLFDHHSVPLDATIRLFPFMNKQKRGVQYKANKFTNSMSPELPIVDFNTVELFVERLTNEYHTVAMFFYDKYNEDQVQEIQMKWKENVGELDAKISRCGLYKLKGGSDVMEINKAEVYEGILLLGTGLVHQVLEKDNVILTNNMQFSMHDMEIEDVKESKIEAEDEEMDSDEEDDEEMDEEEEEDVDSDTDDDTIKLGSGAGAGSMLEILKKMMQNKGDDEENEEEGGDNGEEGEDSEDDEEDEEDDDEEADEDEEEYDSEEDETFELDSSAEAKLAQGSLAEQLGSDMKDISFVESDDEDEDLSSGALPVRKVLIDDESTEDEDESDDEDYEEEDVDLKGRDVPVTRKAAEQAKVVPPIANGGPKASIASPKVAKGGPKASIPSPKVAKGGPKASVPSPKAAVKAKTPKFLLPTASSSQKQKVPVAKGKVVAAASLAANKAAAEKLKSQLGKVAPKKPEPTKVVPQKQQVQSVKVVPKKQEIQKVQPTKPAPKKQEVQPVKVVTKKEKVQLKTETPKLAKKEVPAKSPKMTPGKGKKPKKFDL